MCVQKSLEKLGCSSFELEGDILVQVFDPFVVASDIGSIFLFVRLQTLELVTHVAVAVGKLVFEHVVVHDVPHEFHLEVVFVVKFFAHLCLLEIVAIFGPVAVLGNASLQLLHALEAVVHEHAVVETVLHALHRLLHLIVLLRVHLPHGAAVHRCIQVLCSLLMEVLALHNVERITVCECFCHYLSKRL